MGLYLDFTGVYIAKIEISRKGECDGVNKLCKVMVEPYTLDAP